MGAKIFSKLDIKNAFHQLELEMESREITTFITRKGLFRYKRLMFGINCAPEIFQKILANILIQCEGCANFIDDIIIWAHNKEIHDSRLNKVLQVLEEMGIGLNVEKCVLGVPKILFLGHEFSESGIKPNEDKVKVCSRAKNTERSS
jgi:hypothetical protein